MNAHRFKTVCKAGCKKQVFKVEVYRTCSVPFSARTECDIMCLVG